MEVVMRRLVSIAVFLSVFAFVPLAAQDDDPNVVVAIFFKTLPGKTAAYNSEMREFYVPLYEEFVARGLVVSAQFLVQDAGAGEFTNVVLFEYASWDAADGVSTEDWDDVCGALFGMTFAEKLAEVLSEHGELATLRTLIRTEYYTSLKP
jgi:hypothetical protein